MDMDRKIAIVCIDSLLLTLDCFSGVMEAWSVLSCHRVRGKDMGSKSIDNYVAMATCSVTSNIECCLT